MRTEDDAVVLLEWEIHDMLHRGHRSGVFDAFLGVPFSERTKVRRDIGHTGMENLKWLVVGDDLAVLFDDAWANMPLLQIAHDAFKTLEEL